MVGPQVHSTAKLVLIGSIRQDELEAIDAIHGQIREMRLLLEKRCGPILDRLMDGIPVDPGPHSAELTIRPQGQGRLVHLVLDGRILE